MSKDFATSTLFNAAASIALIAGGFLTTVIVARLLGPEAVGIVAYAAFIVTISLAVLDMGVPGMLQRYLPELEAESREDEADALIRMCFGPYFLASAVVAAAVMLLLDPASLGVSGSSPGERSIVALVGGAVLAQSMAAFYYGMLRGQRRFALLAKVALLSALLQLAVAGVGSMLFGIAGALAAPVAGFLIGAVLAVKSLSRRGRLEKTLRMRAVNYSWRTWGTYFLTTVAWSRMEIFFLKTSWGDHAAGLFAAGLNLSNLALQAPMLLTGAMVPFLVIQSRSASPEQFARSFADAVRYFAMLVFPACLGAAAIAPTLLPLIFGQAFADAVVPAMILIAGSASASFITIVQRYAFAVERTGAVLSFSAIGAALSVLSGLTLVPAFGPTGAAIGRVGAQAVVAAGLLAYAHSLGWRSPWKTLAGILAASIIAAALAGLITRLMPDIGGIVTAICTAVVAYIVLVKYFQVLSEDDHRLVDGLADAASLPPLLRSSFAHTASWLRK